MLTIRWWWCRRITESEKDKGNEQRYRVPSQILDSNSYHIRKWPRIVNDTHSKPIFTIILSHSSFILLSCLMHYSYITCSRISKHTLLANPRAWYILRVYILLSALCFCFAVYNIFLLIRSLLHYIYFFHSDFSIFLVFLFSSLSSFICHPQINPYKTPSFLDTVSHALYWIHTVVVVLVCKRTFTRFQS